LQDLSLREEVIDFESVNERFLRELSATILCETEGIMHTEVTCVLYWRGSRAAAFTLATPHAASAAIDLKMAIVSSAILGS
jgi:hypothetical protein